MYSNCCCSCTFEPEIIKLGQSSYKMYSNNILNFQESKTILNDHTKKVWKLIVCSSWVYIYIYIEREREKGSYTPLCVGRYMHETVWERIYIYTVDTHIREHTINVLPCFHIYVCICAYTHVCVCVCMRYLSKIPLWETAGQLNTPTVSLQRYKTSSPSMNILGMTLNCIWWWDSSPRALRHLKDSSLPLLSGLLWP